jgi:hypothetical protein
MSEVVLGASDNGEPQRRPAAIPTGSEGAPSESALSRVPGDARGNIDNTIDENLDTGSRPGGKPAHPRGWFALLGVLPP